MTPIIVAVKTMMVTMTMMPMKTVIMMMMMMMMMMMIECIKTTSMENVSTGVLKNKD